MLDDGIAKAAAGLTTLEEVLRVAPRFDVPSAVLTPQEATPATVASPSPSEAAPVVDLRKSILILEDDVDMQQLLRLILDEAGYRTSVADDGVEALMELGRTRFDLILSDINMPFLDGLKLFELKNKKGIDTPVVFLTADSESEQQCLALGAADYIQKPLRKNVLLLRIERALQ